MPVVIVVDAGLTPFPRTSGAKGAKPLMLTENPVAAIQAAKQGRGADVVLELVGSSDAMNLCIDIARQYAKINNIGLQTGPRTFEGNSLYLKNLTISWGSCPEVSSRRRWRAYSRYRIRSNFSVIGR